MSRKHKDAWFNIGKFIGGGILFCLFIAFILGIVVAFFMGMSWLLMTLYNFLAGQFAWPVINYTTAMVSYGLLMIIGGLFRGRVVTKA